MVIYSSRLGEIPLLSAGNSLRRVTRLHHVNSHSGLLLVSIIAGISPLPSNSPCRVTRLHVKQSRSPRTGILWERDCLTFCPAWASITRLATTLRPFSIAVPLPARAERALKICSRGRDGSKKQ